jgi:hypothetical protein
MGKGKTTRLLVEEVKTLVPMIRLTEAEREVQKRHLSLN